MESLAYIAVFLMGFVLGLLGGGGSILTVPILMYGFGVSAKLATSYSLIVVGFGSSIGLMNYSKRKLVRYKKGLLFALPSMLGVWISRVLILPALPQEMLVIGQTISKDDLITMVFAAAVMVISVYMFRSKTPKSKEKAPKSPERYPQMIGAGVAVGLLTGFIGAGGGFVIVPALVALLSMTLHEAIATALLVIFLNSGVGILGDLMMKVAIDWTLLSMIILIALGGVWMGTTLNHLWPAQQLRKGFAILVATVGVTMIVLQF